MDVTRMGIDFPLILDENRFKRVPGVGIRRHQILIDTITGLRLLFYPCIDTVQLTVTFLAQLLGVMTPFVSVAEFNNQKGMLQTFVRNSITSQQLLTFNCDMYSELQSTLIYQHQLAGIEALDFILGRYIKDAHLSNRLIIVQLSDKEWEILSDRTQQRVRWLAKKFNSIQRFGGLATIDYEGNYILTRPLDDDYPWPKFYTDDIYATLQMLPWLTTDTHSLLSDWLSPDQHKLIHDNMNHLLERYDKMNRFLLPSPTNDLPTGQVVTQRWLASNSRLNILR